MADVVMASTSDSNNTTTTTNDNNAQSNNTNNNSNSKENNYKQLIIEQSKKRKRSLDLKGKSIQQLFLDDFTPEALNNQDEIDLCGNYLTTLHPNVFSKFTNLQVLNLMSNELLQIPSLEALPNLKELYLSKNNITQITSLELYPQLQVLDLRANKIENLTNLEKAPNLVKLSLSSNRITHIASMPILPLLKTLFLFGCMLTDRGDCIEGLKRNPELETLILRANPVDPMGGEKDDPEFGAFKLKILQTLPKLKYLDWQPVQNKS